MEEPANPRASGTSQKPTPTDRAHREPPGRGRRDRGGGQRGGGQRAGRERGGGQRWAWAARDRGVRGGSAEPGSAAVGSVRAGSALLQGLAARRGDSRRWAVLLAGLLTLTATCAFGYGLPFLVPAFRAAGLTLAEAGVLISAPIAGVLSSLVVWGAVTDRVGERRVLLVGLSATVALLVARASSATRSRSACCWRREVRPVRACTSRAAA